MEGRIVLHAIRIWASDVWGVICVPPPVRSIAFHCRLLEDEHGRRYPEFFRINFSRCIFCGYCEEACPTYAIQLIPDLKWESTIAKPGVREK